MDELQRLFQSPPAIYRSAPQWSWNGELTEERITEQLQDFAEQGCGALFPHARPGHIAGYLTDRWFKRWCYAVDEAKRLGMELHIYDEFTCPGGVAGGHVIANHPELETLTLRPIPVTDPDASVDGEVLAWARIEDGAARQATEGDRRNASCESPVIALAMQRSSGRNGQFPVPDLLRHGSGDAFVESTHEKYADWGADRFNDGCRFVFCDEPHILGNGLTLSRELLLEFHRDHGYHLEDRLVEMCYGGSDADSVRYDYWATVNRLFVDNFMRPLYDWCEQQGLELTGHLMDAVWPSPACHPSNAWAMRFMQAPGNDLLGFQFEATRPEDNGIYLLTLKELQGVGNQLGRRWRLVETAGADGYDTAFETFKPVEDYCMAAGVNVIDPHLGHESLAGIRKYDWPQTLTSHSPWWPYYHHEAEHVARVNAAMCQGTEHNRVLVLQPTTSAWLHWVPKGLDLDGAAEAERARLKKSHTDFVVELAKAQVDFELGDEYVIEEFGSAAGGKFTVGECTYDLVVVPPDMENVRSATLDLLGDYVESGGALLAMTPPTHVDGKPSEAAAELAAAEGWQECDTVAALVAEARKLVPPQLAAPDGGPLPGGLVWRRVEVDDGVLWFLCNPWEDAIEAEVLLPGRSVVEFDTADGSIRPLKSRPEGDGVVLSLNLPPQGHVLWLCRDEPMDQAAPELPQPLDQHASVSLQAVERLEDNIMFIDYCDFRTEMGGTQDINTAVAYQRNWALQGWECGMRGPWTKQFKRNVVDRDVLEGTFLEVAYRFVVDEAVIGQGADTLRLVVERPALYEVTLNGEPLDVATGRRYRDPDWIALPIGQAVVAGENVLTLRAEPFGPLCEIMPIYLLGDFALEPAERGFTAVPSTMPGLEDWTSAGHPFYDQKMRYRFQVDLPADCDAVRVRLPEWCGPVADVSWDGDHAGDVLHPPFQVQADGPQKAGPHELVVDVVGNMKNFMGPHFCDGLPGIWSWVDCPNRMPPGEEYRVYPTGLFAEPEVTLLRR